MNIVDLSQILGGFMHLEMANTDSSLVITLYFIMKMLPMIISGGCIYLGYRLFILGVTGEASIIVDSTTVSGQLLNAAPGLFFAVGGIVALIFSIVKGVKINANDEGIAAP